MLKLSVVLSEKVEEITSITDDVCKRFITEEYANIVKKAVIALAHLPNSPLLKGKTKSWACGITHAIGMINFLYDSDQKPYLSTQELYRHFGVGQSTGQAKSKIVRDQLSMNQMDSEWSIQDRVNENPFTWLFEIDGKIIDIRNASIAFQRAFFEKGLIPFIPAQKKRT